MHYKLLNRIYFQQIAAHRITASPHSRIFSLTLSRFHAYTLSRISLSLLLPNRKASIIEYNQQRKINDRA